MVLNGLYPSVTVDAVLTVKSGEDDDTVVVVVGRCLPIEGERLVLLEVERFLRLGCRKCPTII